MSELDEILAKKLIEILKTRFESGEITKIEYVEMKQELELLN